ncbi:MAG: choloylglycine hydrolase family protein [Clostridiales bacterium]|nr:choloylglycine hydrolase family protein [Clostridiales bacterium]
MCTAIAYKNGDLYFGRNLDLDHSYDERVTITPRCYPLHFDRLGSASDLTAHHAMIGMAYIVDDYPLYYDATNEKGLSMAGLNFPGFARYLPEATGMYNILPAEFIPWILGQCASVSEARTLIARTNLVDIAFRRDLPNTPLHWIIAGHDGCIAVEPMEDGLKVHDDPAEVLTNSPPFDFHMLNLPRYMTLSPMPPENRFSKEIPLKPYGLGMGAMGLPGDLSSASRFVRAAFVKHNSISGKNEPANVNQVFHILSNVAYPCGSVQLGKDRCQTTRYTSCCNADKGIYYYTTYENSRVTAVRLRREDKCGSDLIAFPLRKEWDVREEN